MTKNTELKERLIKGRKRDGRCIYDEQAKSELIRACLKRGVSVARMALEHGINANMLRTWIAYHQRQELQSPSSGQAGENVIFDPASASKTEIVTESKASMIIESPAPAFVPVVQAPIAVSPVPELAIGLHVRLPNGVQFDLDEASLEELSSVVQMLGRMKCSGSTKG